VNVLRVRATILAVALCAASSSLGCVSKPVLELYSARVASASQQGVGLELTMQVNNKNSFDVKIRNVRASVLLAGRHQMPPIAYDPNQWLGAGRSTLVRVPAVIPWNQVGPLLRTTARSSEISYRVKGLADVTAVRMLGIQVNDYELDEEGSVPRSALLRAAGRGFGL
jgi:hypothetical protein